jgi:hypothetical protein
MKFKESMKVGFLILVASLTLVLTACKDKKAAEASRIVKTWIGKEIQFPEDIQCCILGKETDSDFCIDLLRRNYKILLYVDSLECSSCRLKLPEWKQLIEESDSIFQGDLGFVLFFQPKNRRDMVNVFKQANFTYPLFLDINNSINKLNHFPQQQPYQCFLLDKNNKVLMIGNPALNPKIWDLYKKHISGNNPSQRNFTSVEIDKTAYNFEAIKVGESNKVVFQLRNTGTYPLVINHVSTSCGCLTVKWEKQPVIPEKSIQIEVEIKAEEAYFSKTIEVHCNIKESPIKLSISGMAEKKEIVKNKILKPDTSDGFQLLEGYNILSKYFKN